MGVVEWALSGFDLVVPLGMQAPGAVCGYADRGRAAYLRAVALALALALEPCQARECRRRCTPSVPALGCQDWHEHNWTYRPPCGPGAGGAGSEASPSRSGRGGRTTRRPGSSISHGHGAGAVR